jgi:hypothetical protein
VFESSEELKRKKREYETVIRKSREESQELIRAAELLIRDIDAKLRKRSHEPEREEQLMGRPRIRTPEHPRW